MAVENSIGEGKTLNHLIEEFFGTARKDLEKIQAGIVFLRGDGIVIYHNLPTHEAFVAHSIGALVGGAWHASNALMGVLPGNAFEEKTQDGFRLSFDTSSKGIYILPLKILGENFLMAMLYSKAVNPGRLKNELRLINESMKDYLMQKIDSGSLVEKSKNDSNKEFLFQDITDAEIERIFNFAE